MSTLPTESLPINNPEDFKSTKQSALDGSPQNHNGQQLENLLHPPLPFRKYTRQQLVHLSTSPLVKPPPNMPELKVWFGSENENLVKKEDPFTPSTARERRFRRDTDDGDAPSRPTFRSGLTQPSQMGNFKHQSIRASDRDKERDRDRDGEKERERDIRDKEGQERLRHLSDKYDRDRLAQPQSNARNKERDPAPHLNAPARPAQAPASNSASRRAETRESVKKKIGETSEDWRRGAEPPRTSRDDRAENGKREDRDRARSRGRDSSGAKREPSSSRRDRERDEPRERPLRGERERDDHRKDDARRDRDFETEEDARRWRDDGKREERIAARRERGRDKGNQDGHWEGGTDRRWTPGDDRDGRYKRSSGRERRTGNGPDDVKDKDDRRDKEREKEKEPAWMDAYVPSDSSPAILGGHGLSGELDGIQAFKKEQKDKELKDKAANLSAPLVAQGLEETSMSILHADMKQEPLDEIQLFKRMMLKDQRNLNPNPFPNQHETHSSSKDDGIMTSSKPRHIEDSAIVTGFFGPVSKIDHSQFRTSKDSSSSTNSSSLILDPKEPPSLTKVLPTPDLSPNRNSANDISGFAAPETSQINPAKQAVEPNATSSFQPPAGSRLLAFAKAPANLGTLENNIHPSHESTQNYAKPESSQPLSAFSPFEEQRRQAHGFEDTRDMGMSLNVNIHHRPMEPIFNSNVNSPDPNFNGVSGPKGSRFAKFFDGKGRDGIPPLKQQLPGVFLSPSPNQNQRPEQSGFGSLNVNPGDGRTMDDLFAMLRNSTQQGNLTQSPNVSTPLTNNGTLTQGQGLYTLQHPLQQTQHHGNRLEPLYDSRADDRSFVPDGMVPGLRPIPPLRRDNNAAQLGDDDSMHYNLQRIAQQQQSRTLDSLYPGPTPIYGQQTNRQAGLPMQSLQLPHYRGGPSPNLNQLGPLPTGPPQQRLPPGLANLGGRPPHEPSQFIGLPGPPSNGPHASLHTNPLLQQQQQQIPFNNFNTNNSFSSAQPRGPAPSHVHNGNAQQHPLGNIGLPNMDPRLANHHHIMGLGGSGIGGTRTNGSFPHQGPAAPSHPVMRSQQQPHLMPQLLPHLLPPHLQQQGHPGNNQPTHDLMALLMGGHRE